ncbi:MAG: hypothetical protein RSE44_28735, partial [Pseudomonas sp.]
MPTENRTSNTELKKIVAEALVAMVSGVTGMRPPADAPLPDFIRGPVDQAAERIGTLLAQPAAQHQGEPVPPYLWVREENDCIEDYTRDPSLAEDWARDEWPITKPLYLHPPTSDGYSAGDMADQGAKAFAARDV